VISAIGLLTPEWSAWDRDYAVSGEFRLMRCHDLLRGWLHIRKPVNVLSGSLRVIAFRHRRFWIIHRHQSPLSSMSLSQQTKNQPAAQAEPIKTIEITTSIVSIMAHHAAK
jgi:hypothetical protein